MARIDLIWNGYTITDERKQKVLFTKPYLKNAQVVVTLADSKLTKLDDLAEKWLDFKLFHLHQML